MRAQRYATKGSRSRDFRADHEHDQRHPRTLDGRLGARRYGVRVGEDMVTVGDTPLADGMTISVRYRRDFVVSDAAGLLETARRMFRELNHASPEEATAAVTCAADAIYTLLEHDGLIGETIDARLAGHEPDGLTALAWRAEVVLNDPEALPAGPDCYRTGDVFALPASAPDTDHAAHHHDDR